MAVSHQRASAGGARWYNHDNFTIVTSFSSSTIPFTCSRTLQRHGCFPFRYPIRFAARAPFFGAPNLSIWDLFLMAYGESEMVSIRGYRGFFPLALFGVFATVAAATRPSLPWVFAYATEKTRFD